MTILESYWMNNKEWYSYNDEGDPVIKESAPQKAKESYEKFLIQRAEAEKRGTL